METSKCMFYASNVSSDSGLRFREAESPSKRSKVYVDDDEDSDQRGAGDEAQSDDDQVAEKKSEVGELIADIFGDSDEEAAGSDAVCSPDICFAFHL